MGKGPLSEVVGMKPESMGGGMGGLPAGILSAAGMGMGCIFWHGCWKVDCVTVWFLDMKLNWIMSYCAAWTLSGE